MSGSSFIQFVGVMDKKELFDEALQEFIIKLPVMSWNPTYCQTGAFAFRLENESSAIILSVSGLQAKNLNVTPVVLQLCFWVDISGQMCLSFDGN